MWGAKNSAVSAPVVLEASRKGSWEDHKAQAAQCQLGAGELYGVWGSG